MKTNAQKTNSIWIGVALSIVLLLLFASPQRAVAQWATSGNNISNTNSGNVGVGTTAPQNKLTVTQSSGGTGFGGTDGTGGVRVSWATGYGVSMDAWDAPTPRWGILKFTGNTPTVMMEGLYYNNDVIFNSGGNVGIGTTTPTLGKLQVAGMVGNTSAVFGSDGTGVGLIQNWGQVGFNTYYNGGFKAINTGFGGTVGVDQSTGGIFFRTADTVTGAGTSQTQIERMRIDNAGNVGIGTASPASGYKLDVAGTINATGLNINGSPVTGSVF